MSLDEGDPLRPPTSTRDSACPSMTTTCARTRRARFARVRQAEVIGVDGAKHLWVGESAVRRVLDEIVVHVLPGRAEPLPTTWPGAAGRPEESS